jgi:hypothetical protein
MTPPIAGPSTHAQGTFRSNGPCGAVPLFEYCRIERSCVKAPMPQLQFVVVVHSEYTQSTHVVEFGHATVSVKLKSSQEIPPYAPRTVAVRTRDVVLLVQSVVQLVHSLHSPITQSTGMCVSQYAPVQSVGHEQMPFAALHVPPLHPSVAHP